MATNEDHMRTVHTLPDDALLQIFGFCRPEVETFTGRAFYLPSWPWHMLAHVCRRWRQVILASPMRLGVQHHITHGSPVADILDHPPQLPLVIYYWDFRWQDHDQNNLHPRSDIENIPHILHHFHRVRRMEIKGPASLLRLFEAVAAPSSIIEVLKLQSMERTSLFLPSFLGALAPALRTLSLHNIISRLPSTPLLTDFTLRLERRQETDVHLINELLDNICSMSQLISLILAFDTDEAHDKGSHYPPTPQQVELPALSLISFSGPSVILEALMCRISATNLESLNVSIRNRSAVLIPSLSRFIQGSPDLLAPVAVTMELSLDPIRYITVLVQRGIVYFRLPLYSPHQPDSTSTTAAYSVSAVCHTLAPVLSLAHSLLVRGRIRANGLESIWIMNPSEWDDIFPVFAGITQLELQSVFNASIREALQPRNGVMHLPRLQEVNVFSFRRFERIPVPTPEEFQPILAARSSANRTAA